MKKWILAALLGFSSVGAFADSTSFVSGYTCGQYVESPDRVRYQYGAMVVGYVSAANQIRSRMTPTLQPQDLILWVTEYCKGNPLDNLADALVSLDKALDAQQKRK